MKQNLLLTVASLLSILLMTFHLSDDVVRGIEPGGIKNMIGIIILVIWLYGTLVLAGRRSGYIIILLGSILGAGIPIVHMTGAGLVGDKIVAFGGVFFFVWTLLALGVTASFSLLLSAQAFWKLQKRRVE